MQTAADRLGVADFGDENALVGNYLIYPRRVVLEFIKIAFSQPNFFTPVSAGASETDANPFIYKELPDGTLDPKSRLVVVDYGSEHTVRGEGRPRVVVGRSSGTFSHASLMARTQRGFLGVGPERSFELFETSLVIRCVGRSKIESELLGLSVVTLLTFFSGQLREKSRLHHIGSPTVGETQPEKFDSEAEQYTTQITLPLSQTVGWLKSAITDTVLADVSARIQEI